MLTSDKSYDKEQDQDFKYEMIKIQVFKYEIVMIPIFKYVQNKKKFLRIKTSFQVWWQASGLVLYRPVT